MQSSRKSLEQQLSQDIFDEIAHADTSLVLTPEQLDEFHEGEAVAWAEYLAEMAGRDVEPEVDVKLVVRVMPRRTGRRPRGRAHRRAHRAGVAADGPTRHAARVASLWGEVLS